MTVDEAKQTTCLVIQMFEYLTNYVPDGKPKDISGQKEMV